MRNAVFAVIAVALTAYAISNRTIVAPVAAQAQACLPGDPEVSAERARRFQALAVARDVNTMQAVAAAEANGVYQPLLKLKLTVKDTLDPCMFAYFSDQSGIILVGRVIQ